MRVDVPLAFLGRIRRIKKQMRAEWRHGVVTLAGLGATCIAMPTEVATNHAAQCGALTGKLVAAGRLTLASSGAQVEMAEYVNPHYCKVLGFIKPVDPEAPPIRFQINLPTGWNGKSLQCGGGGLNGNLISCTTPLRDAPPVQTPLQRGYVTFGTDGGHQNAPDRDLQSFALNDEALHNHAYGAYKKTFDVAQVLIADHYGRKPTRSYFFGGSEGGREALLAVQKYPQDYDGVVSVVPLVSWTGPQFAGYRQYLAASGDGWMDAAKVALVHNATLSACDAEDGLTDGMIAKYIGCDSAANVRALRCPDGKDSGDKCLSDAQIALVETVRSPTPYGFAVANRENDYPAYAIGAEAHPGNMIPTIVAPTRPAPDDKGKAVYAVGDVRYFYLRDPAHHGPVDWKQHARRIGEVSLLMDQTNPDLRAFKRSGGKLIMKSNANDYLVSPGSVWRYYERVNATMGRGSVDEFMRLYVAPWTSHRGDGRAGDGTPTPDKVDLLAALEAWVEDGVAPGDSLVLTSYAGEGAAALPVASWPMCSYPDYPHYRGSGDVKAAANYACRSAK